MDLNVWGNIFRALSFWGAISAAICAIFVAIGSYGTQYCSSKIEAQRHAVMDSKNNKIILLQEENLQSQKILQAKTEEIKNLNNRINATVTGGDSFCYITIEMVDNSNNVRMWAISHGQYPVYDAAVRIVDLEKFGEMMKKDQHSLDDIIKNEIHIAVGNMPPASAMSVGKGNLGVGNEKKYNVFISARNGFFTELIRLKRVDGKWKEAIKVKDKNNDVVLYEKIDEQFPGLVDGKIDWD
jgi:hypothetical protein